jgi:pyruvate, orthophosphate dikinase
MSYVSPFTAGSAAERALLGGKGANLAEMTRMGLPVPPGFTITTTACLAYLRQGHVPHGLPAEIDAALHELEETHGQRLGDPADPLLLSVRSGAAVSMPGMMDTVLNLGLNAETLKGLIERTGDERFAYDAYRRFLEMFSTVVLRVPSESLAKWRDGVLRAHDVADASGLDADGLHDLAQAYRQAVRQVTGAEVPEDARRQLDLAIVAVFESWNGRRARDYRAMEGLPDDMGTAVNIQAMVFGNAGEDSGTGVAFTRDPATGEPQPYGDFLANAQGEDVVAGIRATEPLAALADHFPEAGLKLDQVMERLERRYGDMCDIEFTIERGELYILQTRVGKRTSTAAVRIAVDQVDEGMITVEEAIGRVDAQRLDELLHPRFADGGADPLATGLAASPGAAVGRAVFTADAAEEWHARGERVILVRPETSPEDLHGMIAAEAILTSRGGLVSHAAVVARGMGKPAVCGAHQLEIDVERRRARVGATAIAEGDLLSVDGTAGAVHVGERELVAPEVPPELDRLLGWADEHARLEVRANADTAEDATRAREFGARGIGLCRTEHQFLGDRLPIVQDLLTTDDPEVQASVLERLHDVQVEDFTAILEAMDGLPVTVRLLDPPLHEFLPDIDELLVADARDELDDVGRALFDAAMRLREHDPMLGTRGVRLGLLMPELYRMQVRSLAEAFRARRDAGGDPRPAVMIPLVSIPEELRRAAADAREVLEEVLGDDAADVPVGTMIETPRAALVAGELAETAEFFSMGTNDLTQLTFGFSRDDLEARVMPTYLQERILTGDPFGHLDEVGVGELVRAAVDRGRETSPVLEVGICGEHGGDPASIRFCHAAGVDYVSCSPFRVPTARLAAGQAAVDTVDHEGE